MAFGGYVDRVLLEAGTTLGIAAPALLLAAWHSHVRRWGKLFVVIILVLLNSAILNIPRTERFQHRHWSWQESLLTAAWPFLLVAVSPAISLNSIGVTSRFCKGWLKPSTAALLVALAVPSLFFLLGARKDLDLEGWVFLLTMPGLAEELVFRGVFQSLLNSMFGRPWRVAGAEIGWGLIIAAILFACYNGLVSVDSHLRVNPSAAIAPFTLSLVSGWVRERTGSVWPSVLGHNLSNVVIPLETLLVPH
jgi:membrane protease YdiL (CAAX protease family)